ITDIGASPIRIDVSARKLRGSGVMLAQLAPQLFAARGKPLGLGELLLNLFAWFELLAFSSACVDESLVVLRHLYRLELGSWLFPYEVKGSLSQKGALENLASSSACLGFRGRAGKHNGEPELDSGSPNLHNLCGYDVACGEALRSLSYGELDSLAFV